MNDPKSVELVYDKEICSRAEEPREECYGRKGLYTIANRFEELFGEGVGLKDITLKITDEPMTVGVVDQFLPEKLNNLRENWRELPCSEKARINPLITFKRGGNVQRHSKRY